MGQVVWLGTHGCWRLAAGGWRLAAGGWRLAAGFRPFQLPHETTTGSKHGFDPVSPPGGGKGGTWNLGLVDV
jgi:hypothetical protein